MRRVLLLLMSFALVGSVAVPATSAQNAQGGKEVPASSSAGTHEVPLLP